MGFDRSAGRLIELGERQCRDYLVASRALLAGDRDGGLVSLFGERGIDGIAFEQDVAPNAMQEGVNEPLACFACSTQRLFDRG